MKSGFCQSHVMCMWVYFQRKFFFTLKLNKHDVNYQKCLPNHHCVKFVPIVFLGKILEILQVQLTRVWLIKLCISQWSSEHLASCKKELGDQKMTYQGHKPPAKPDDLCLIPGTHRAEPES